MATSLTLNAVHRAAGARFVEDLGHELPASFGDPAAEQGFVRSTAAVFDRSYRGVLDLSGKDAGKVMNGVFSSAVARLVPGDGQLSTLLDAKGRLIAAFELFALADSTLRLVFFEPLRDAAVKAIQKYTFLSDIAIADRSADVGILSIEGPAAQRVLETAAGGAALPRRELEARSITIAGVGGVTAVCGGETPERGFELWVPRGALETVWSAVAGALRAAGGGPAGHEAAEALRIEAGIARQGRDYGEENFPNDAGWEPALTYDKCYVGQEIVARMKTYGQANRRLKGIIIAGARVPSVPCAVRCAGEEAGKATSAAFSVRLGRPIALAMVKRKLWEADTAALDVPGGPLDGKLVELPFVRLDETRAG